MICGISNFPSNQDFTPKITPKIVVKLVAKVALLVLAAPITLVLFAASFKGRIVDWLTSDWIRKSCWNVWDGFYNQHKEKLNEDFKLNKDDFCKKHQLNEYGYECVKIILNESYELDSSEFCEFFNSFPKIVTYLSNKFSSDKVGEDEKISYYKRYVFLFKESQCNSDPEVKTKLKNLESGLGRDLTETKKIAEADIAKKR